MKYLISFFIGFLIFTNCNNDKTTDSQLKSESKKLNKNNNFSKVYEGLINNKYGIIMSLTAINGELSGNYFYKSQGKEITILGTIDSINNIIVNEFDNSGNQTGIFKGQINDSKINGVWSKPNGMNSMEFLLFENDKALSEYKSVKASSENNDDLSFLNKLNGQYTDAFWNIDKPVFYKRIKKLLNNYFETLREICCVESPIEIKDNKLIATACESHNCNSTNYIVIVDILKNKIYVGLRKDDQIKTFTEDGHTPQEMKDWIKNS